MSENNEKQMTEQLNLFLVSEALSEEELGKASGGITLAGVSKIRKLTGTVDTAPRPTIVWGSGKAGAKGGSPR